jgi:hypothetical protein
LDNLFNTEHLKWALLEIVLMAVMPYPGLHNHFYYEEANDFSAGIAFQWNDFLLCWMILVRLVHVIRVPINFSFYTDPRAQRVCSIYGTDANYSFAIKCIMKDNSY